MTVSKPEPSSDDDRSACIEVMKELGWTFVGYGDNGLPFFTKAPGGESERTKRMRRSLRNGGSSRPRTTGRRVDYVIIDEAPSGTEDLTFGPALVKAECELHGTTGECPCKDEGL